MVWARDPSARAGLAGDAAGRGGLRPWSPGLATIVGRAPGPGTAVRAAGHVALV